MYWCIGFLKNVEILEKKIAEEDRQMVDDDDELILIQPITTKCDDPI